MNPTKKTKHPEPWLIHKKADGWSVQRLVVNEGSLGVEVHSRGLGAREAVALCMQANGDPSIYNPLDVLVHLYVLATQHDHAGANVAAQVLLGLYNGQRFPFDLSELHRIDSELMDMVLALLKFNHPLHKYVHSWLDELYGRDDFGLRFECMALKWGRYEAEFEAPAQPPALSMKSPYQ